MLPAASAGSWRSLEQEQDGFSSFNGRSLFATGSMEERMINSLLPKPLYSDLPKHRGNKLVLVVDGDRGTHVILAGLLGRQSEFLVISAYKAADALELMEQWEYLPNTVLLGLHLQGGSGLQVCRGMAPSYESSACMVSKHV